ncbi:AbrB family transcriptional regulator [Nanoarchaeota archaeon]
MIMQEVKVTRNYQITIPKIIAEELGIKIGDKVIVIYDNNEIKIIPKKTNLLEEIEKLNLKLGEKIEDLDKVINEVISELTDKIEKEYKK